MGAGTIFLFVIGSLLLGQLVSKAIFEIREWYQKEAEVKQQELAARQEKIATTQAELYNLADHLWETGKYIPFFDTVISSNHLLRMLNKKEGEQCSPFLSQPLACANGHKYLLGEFRYIFQTDVNTDVQYQNVASLNNGMIVAGGQSAYVRGVTNTSVPVSITYTTHVCKFGCPSCKTSLYKMDDDHLQEQMQRYAVCPQCGGLWLTDLGACPNCNLGIEMNKLVFEMNELYELRKSSGLWE